MKQLSFFDIEEGRGRQSDGLASIESNHAAWLLQMRAHARAVCYAFGHVTADDLRAYADERRLWPTHSNAWGAVFKEKGWECTGRVYSAYVSNHGREIKRWRWAG